MKTKWTQCKDCLPTEEDGDEFGDIFWCGLSMVVRLSLCTVLDKDFDKEYNRNAYWARTGFKYPVGPNLQ